MLLKNFLKCQPIFRGLSDRDLDALAHAIEVREHPDKHTIIQEGRSGKELYLLIEGQVSVVKYNLKNGHKETGFLRPITNVNIKETSRIVVWINFVGTIYAATK